MRRGGRLPRQPKPKRGGLGGLHAKYKGVSRIRHPHYTYAWLRSTLKAIDRVKLR